MAYTTPRTWVANETLTASNLNTHVRDNLNALYGTTTTYTPQVDQGATTNIAKTVTEARYIQTGRIVQVWLDLNMTAAGTVANLITCTLPVTASGHSTNAVIGHGYYLDSGSQYYVFAAKLSTTTTFIMVPDTGLGGIGTSPSIAMASADATNWNPPSVTWNSSTFAWVMSTAVPPAATNPFKILKSSMN